MRARDLLAPGRACILDVESTGLDGSIIEVAVVAADTGEVLLDRLVDPAGVAISAAAQAVHGISAADLVGAPPWPQVYSDLVAVIGDRRIAAYNAAFDHGRIAHDCARHDINAPGLTDLSRWECVMEIRSAAHCTDERLRLDAGHRALGDVHATREILQQIADGTAA